MAAKRCEERVVDRDQLPASQKLPITKSGGGAYLPSLHTRAVFIGCHPWRKGPRSWFWMNGIGIFCTNSYFLNTKPVRMLARGVVFNVPVWSAVAESAALVNGGDPDTQSALFCEPP